MIYELLVRYITNCIIEGDKKSASVATKIIEKHFSKEKEIYKEFRLINALANSTVSDTHIVASILSEAKRAARNLDKTKLNKEKSSLIRDINYKINKKDFFYQQLSNYRELGTIQITINEWQKNSPDIGKLIEFEKKIGENLLTEKKNKSIVDLQQDLDASKSDKLILKLMTEKINKKYSNLSKSEREIISSYVFYSSQGSEKLESFLSERKRQALKLLENFEEKEKNAILVEKVDRVRQAIESIDASSVNDKTVIRFLTVTKLINELKNNGEQT